MLLPEMLNDRKNWRKGAAGDPFFPKTVLLCGFEGADGATTTTDQSAAPKTLTFVGDAQIDTAQAKIGSSSVLFDGTGDAITAPDSPDFTFGSLPFTVELFVRFATGFSASEAFCGQWGSSVTNCSWFFWLSSGSLQFRFYDTSSTTRDTEVAWTPAVDTWYHLAADRDEFNNFRIYRDGNMVAKTIYTQTMRDGTGLFGIGTVPGQTTLAPLNGWIDELRITKGVARYASDSGFSVPTAAFPRFA
ncbi:LamG domain-containing protein [Mesorhizobium argentiipisi]|uniref:LamG domain-containing protein n=1 Tax=Mesorhizobium argentiipisi TaxID=3015175 RepID=A0ABU8KDC6_9HYPH